METTNLNIPNETTEAAILEGRTLAYEDSVVGYVNMEDLKAALDA